MGVLVREGKVSVVEKSGRYYLRASCPKKDGVGTISRWITVGVSQDKAGLVSAIALAQELDRDLTRWRLGLGFPFSRWANAKEKRRTESDLDECRDWLKLALKESEPVLGNTGDTLDKGRDAGEQFLQAKVWGEQTAYKLQQGWKVYLQVIKNSISPSTYSTKERFGANTLKELTNLVADRMVGTNQEEFNHLLLGLAKECLTPDRQKWFVCQVNRMIRTIELDHPEIEWSGDKVIHRKRKGKEIDFFTKEEATRIVKAFLSGAQCQLLESNIGYQFRMNRVLTIGHFTQFCFMTGCRLSEAAGLRLEDITSGVHIRFCQAIVTSGKRQIVKPGLKTQDFRLFPINAQLQRCIDAAIEHREKERKEGWERRKGLLFVFGGKGYQDKMLYAEWEKVLPRLGIRHRKPYCMRHTFITNCLAKGVPVATVAKWVGNTPQTIYKHYSAATNEDVPEF